MPLAFRPFPSFLSFLSFLSFKAFEALSINFQLCGSIQCSAR
jgi:hypothetical protein